MRFITFSLLYFFMLSSAFAQNTSTGEVVPMDSIDAAIIDSLLQSEELDQSEPTEAEWEEFHANNCGVNVYMPENVTLQKDSTAFSPDSFIYSSTYQSKNYSEGASYTVMCFVFPASYPFKENAETLLLLMNQNLSTLDGAKVISDDIMELYNSKARQFEIKISEGISYYGRAIIADRSIVSFVSSQIKSLEFTDPELQQFFDSVELIKSN